MLGHLCGAGALPVKKGRFGSKLLAKSMVKMKGVDHVLLHCAYKDSLSTTFYSLWSILGFFLFS